MIFLGESKKGCENFIAIHNGTKVFVRKWEYDFDALQYKCPISCQNLASKKCRDHAVGHLDIDKITKELIERANFTINKHLHKNLVPYINIFTEKLQEKLIVYLAQEFVDGSSIKKLREDGKRHHVEIIAREVLLAIESLNTIDERITHDCLTTGSIFVDKTDEFRVSNFHLVPYLMYLNNKYVPLNQYSDYDALGSVIKTENEANYELAKDFIMQCRSKNVVFVDNLLKHPFISNEKCSDVKSRQNDRLLEQFDIESYLGGGSFGQVFKARHQHDKKLCALKLIAIPTKESNRQKMEREVEVISKFDHRNIARYITSWKQPVNLTMLEKYIRTSSVHAAKAK